MIALCVCTGYSALKDTGPRFWQIAWSRSQCFRLMH